MWPDCWGIRQIDHNLQYDIITQNSVCASSSFTVLLSSSALSSYVLLTDACLSHPYMHMICLTVNVNQKNVLNLHHLLSKVLYSMTIGVIMHWYYHSTEYGLCAIVHHNTVHHMTWILHRNLQNFYLKFQTTQNYAMNETSQSWDCTVSLLLYYSMMCPKLGLPIGKYKYVHDSWFVIHDSCHTPWVMIHDPWLLVYGLSFSWVVLTKKDYLQ